MDKATANAIPTAIFYIGLVVALTSVNPWLCLLIPVVRGFLFVAVAAWKTSPQAVKDGLQIVGWLAFAAVGGLLTLIP